MREEVVVEVKKQNQKEENVNGSEVLWKESEGDEGAHPGDSQL